jgi:hypothetical protein
MGYITVKYFSEWHTNNNSKQASSKNVDGDTLLSEFARDVASARSGRFSTNDIIVDENGKTLNMNASLTDNGLVDGSVIYLGIDGNATKTAIDNMMGGRRRGRKSRRGRKCKSSRRRKHKGTRRRRR